MVARVLLTSGGLKVSNPGYDVTTAGIQDLAFDSQYPMMGTTITGTGYCNPLIMDPNVQSNHGTYVYFPSSVAGQIPITIVQWWEGTSTVSVGGGGYCRRTLRYGSEPPWQGGGEIVLDPETGEPISSGRPEYDYPYDYETSSTWGVEYTVHPQYIHVSNFMPYGITFRYVTFFTMGTA